ncbi:MAG: DUF624 domain-containing protein [Lachnospiraceae bacterium]|nr:DUF624 domain-containing protein [Lachnospiraceae bacterium]
MRNWFTPESSFIKGLGRAYDLVILNLITLVFCLPIVTIGASLTAMHYCLLRIHRGEEGYITKDFLHSFKQNFNQGTIIWLFFAFMFALIGLNFYVANQMEMPEGFYTALVILLGVLLSAFLYVFPLLSHFENTVKATISNAVKMVVVCFFPQTVCMLIITVGFGFLYYQFPLFLAIFILLFGITLPSYLCTMLYHEVFLKLEQKEEEESIDTEELENEKRS